MSAWSDLEIEATVASYFEMLSLELAGKRFNKTEYGRALMPLLNSRSKGSIEYKHQNISAVLIGLGAPYIRGYKPAFNYQKRLAEIIAKRLQNQPDLISLSNRVASQAAESPAVLTPEDHFDPEPPESLPNAEPSLRSSQRTYRVDYAAREANNMSLGLAGESFVVALEQRRLLSAGRDSLAQDVEHVSQTQGDGLGYDVVSFNEDGSQRLIEVKTTRSGRYAPFFVTPNELEVSRRADKQFHLYRVYNFAEPIPRLYTKAGALDRRFELTPDSYRATP